MRRTIVLSGLVFLALGLLLFQAPAARPQTAGTAWSFDATYIEACSCHAFCPCYFNKEAEHPFCEFQMAVRVNDGNLGDVQLKGAKYWLAGDLGEEWGTTGKTPWLVVTWDPGVTQAQRDAIAKILMGKIYPFQWSDVKIDESAISWSIREGVARAKLANANGEMVLERFAGADGGPVVLNNVKYFGADSNRGFVVYKSKVHRWDGFGKKFEYSDRNAFTIRIQSSGTL